MQKSETQDRAGTFRLGEGDPCCSQYVELLTLKDEDFSLQSTHHRDVRSFWISGTGNAATPRRPHRIDSWHALDTLGCIPGARNKPARRCQAFSIAVLNKFCRLVAKGGHPVGFSAPITRIPLLTWRN